MIFLVSNVKYLILKTMQAKAGSSPDNTIYLFYEEMLMLISILFNYLISKMIHNLFAQKVGKIRNLSW